MSKITRPRFVDFSVNDDDFEVALLAKYGFTTAHIQHETGLTQCQVNYRLHRAQIKRIDYRSGDSAEAHQVMNFVRRHKVDMERLRDTLARFNTKNRKRKKAAL